MIRFDKEQKDSVRIALNASFLQRLIGTGYYFYDDISVPLVKEGSSVAGTIIPSKPLLSEYDHHDTYCSMMMMSDDQEIRRLWISLCSRLARNEQQYQNNHQKYLAVFLILWLVAITLLLVLISDVYELPPALLLLIPALLAVSTKWVFICLPEKHGVHFTKGLLVQCNNHHDHDEDAVGLEQEEYFQQIQSIVDDLATSFAEIGCTLDYVEDFRSNCPFLAYIRMTAPANNNNEDSDDSEAVLVKNLGSSSDDGGYVLVDNDDEAGPSVSSSNNASSSSSSSPSLSERLCKFQREAWEEHSGQVADQIQLKYRTKQPTTKNDPTTTRLLGIPIQKIASYRTAIICASIPIGFFWVCLNSGFLSYPAAAQVYHG